MANSLAQAQGMVENCPRLTSLVLELQGAAKQMSGFSCTPGELAVRMRSQPQSFSGHGLGLDRLILAHEFLGLLT